MHRLIILLLIHHLCISPLIGQKEYAFELLHLEKEIFLASSEKVDSLKLKKINFMIKADSLKGQILTEVRRVNYQKLPDSIRGKALWNASLIAYMNEDLDLSFLYWSKYEFQTKDTSIECQLLGYLTSKDQDNLLNRNLCTSLSLHDELFLQFDKELNKSVDVKGRTLKKVCSYLLPGTGLLLNGNLAKGLLSMGINTGTVFLIRFLVINNAWVNSVLWGSNLIGKFYLGNTRLTDREIELKQLQKKRMRAESSSHLLIIILNKYPLKVQLFN